jgi:hypothetical protein
MSGKVAKLREHDRAAKRAAKRKKKQTGKKRES